MINLDRASERLAHTCSEFGRAGVAFERLAGVDGAALPARELEAFMEARSAADPRQWLPGEVGCFLSHFEAWRRIAAGEEAWGAVFEDDLRVSPDLATLLESTGWIPEDADVLKLDANRSMRLAGRRQIPGLPGRHLYRAIGGTFGAGAYILSRSAAEGLLATPPQTHTSVDVFLFKPKKSSVAKTLRRYQVVPAVCVQDGLPEGREGTMKSQIRDVVVLGRGYRSRSHPLLRLWPIRRIAVPYRF